MGAGGFALPGRTSLRDMPHRQELNERKK